jgi:peptidoglycan/xylan/chitin deacetylase (PgdA/CDA1 family)
VTARPLPLAGRLVRFSTGGSLLCFHSLTTAELPSEGLVNLPLHHFISLCRRIKPVTTFVPLAEILEQHRHGRSTGGAVALTFDDAYAALLLAIPFIRAERLPLTVFVTTGAAEGGRRFWWDRVDDLFPRIAPGRWRVFEDTLGVPDAYRSGQPRELGPLRPLRQWVLAEHKGRWSEALEAPLKQLETEAGFETPHRSMDYRELAQLSAESTVDFGVHTVTHPVLPLLDAAEFRAEVGGAYDVLRERLPRVHPVLAIPFGLHDALTAGRSKDAGMTDCLTLAGRTLQGFPSDGGLPRFCLTRNEPGWKLALRVTGAAERFLGKRLEGGRSYPDLPSPTS